ncbi:MULTISPECIES: invasion protein CiaB [unclassified Campylobacter]|uniref:invasion protein CiaB n=1 Tax=unclassified Campylobacter TaxID=2593542 RepID=UPI0022E9D594|nr:MULTISPECIES: invasion protein CiaB [unclassified Campylobacter]MDA3055149.1 invasion protein CiaB [Campylobacter sp. VBCF_07 NA4]MDA3061401.1 invasion protein CiaB [Campylobacter sp. VBCF_02 NA5]MDA3070918.1 invasion protein CiaB [Campylobacter sp. VBCF_08 NA3]WBR54059.1 invasion protein CiaB [Campylobacter sp. VBCF_01 NA2]
MNNFDRLNELVSETKANLNALYANSDSEIIKQGLQICEFSDTQSAKIAILRRIVDLKEEAMMQEFRKLGYDANKQSLLREKMYDYVRQIHSDMHAALIAKIEEEKILNPFYLELIKSVHKIGLVINQMQKSWQKLIIDTNNKRLEMNFASIADAKEYLFENELLQRTPHDEICDRCYGAIIQDSEGKFVMAPYAVAFEEDSKELIGTFNKAILELEDLASNAEERAYIYYLAKLRTAFAERNNVFVIGAWRDAEMAWMETKSPIQIGHPLEYYEDNYTHAVALEWDIRLSQPTRFDADKFKAEISASFDKIYKQIGANSPVMRSLVLSNIDKTQLYISTPMIYYGADLNGLFSAQVVPNDEFVSTNCGKKIFAFVNFVYESAKAKPFMKISSQIFDLDYLNFGREILFKQPKIWRMVYEISTIGHEFGHIFFIDEDTESLMNKSGAFKLVEEYKATTGGLINFFFNEKPEMRLPVLDELIRRSVGLIAWQRVNDVRPYYCEGLIHLTLLFRSGVLKFDGAKLAVDFSEAGYERFKKICLKNYEILASTYYKKLDAYDFLDGFVENTSGVYLPKDAVCREFVEYYYALYEKIGNEIDESGEREKWVN